MSAEDSHSIPPPAAPDAAQSPPRADESPDAGTSAPINTPEDILRPALSQPLPPTPSREFDPSVPEDLRAPWGWLDLLVFLVVGFFSLIAVIACVAIVAVTAFHVPLDTLKAKSMTDALATISIVGQGIWSVGVLLFFYIMVRSRTSAPFWRTIGWRGLGNGGNTLGSALGLAGTGAILAVCVSLLGKLFGEKEGLPIEEMFRSRQTVILLMSFGILVAPLVEETIFRGFLYPLFARAFGVPAGVVVTGTLFGLMHAAQLWGGWGQIGLLIVVGIIFTYVRARTGTVAASYCVHIGYNGLLFGFFFIATSGLKHLPVAH